MAFRTRPIVRPDVTNRMVTEGYRKGVYERVTKGTSSFQVGWPSKPSDEQVTNIVGRGTEPFITG